MIQNIEKIENLLKIGKYDVMYRIDHNGKRLYIQEEPFKYYSGLTSAIEASTFQGDPQSKALNKWREKFIDQYGKRQQEDYVAMTADFGTLLHESIVTIKEKGEIKWKEEFDKAIHYFTSSYKSRGMEPNMNVVRSMALEYQKHVASLMTWVHERVTAIYAVETPAKNDDLMIATPIDVFCECRHTPKASPVKTTVNIKTSSSITSHQLDQVSCEMVMWNDTYGDAAATGIIRTKDWNKKPTYEFKGIDGTEAMLRYGQISSRMSLCLQSSSTYYPQINNISFKGVTKIGEEVKIQNLTLEQEWMEAREALSEATGSNNN